MDKKCLSGYLVYNALVDRLDTNKTKHYYGACEKNFKERYNSHRAYSRNINKEKSTELAKYIWELKYICAFLLKLIRMYAEGESAIYA